MKTFKEFLNEESEGDYLYHATYHPYLEDIKKEGLHGDNPKKNYEDSEHGKVYLAKDPHTALSYAETSDHVPEHYLNKIHVLKIHKKHLDPSKIKDDSNVRNSDHSTVEYRGKIPPEHIKLHSTHEG